MAAVDEHCAPVQATREAAASSRVLCNRTHREWPTHGGPDADCRDALTAGGARVWDSHLPHSDRRFRHVVATP